MSPRRPIHMPLWSVVVLAFFSISGPILSITASVSIANHNSQRLIQRYEADQAATQNANRTIYCVLFGSQIDALEDSTTPIGQASRRAWLAVYKLARCQPERK